MKREERKMLLSAEGTPLAPEARKAPAEIIEPVEPGTSEQYLGGRPFHQYMLWTGLATLAITALLGATSGILLPNQMQELAFAQWFTGPYAHVDLTTLSDLI
jgi:hypothetical protein